MTAPPLLLEATLRFLRAHEPFARMARRDLEFLAGRARLGYYPAGSIVVDASGEAAAALYVVQRGHVRAGEAAAGAVLGPGECFPLDAGGAASATRYLATEDAFCLQLDAVDAAALRVMSAPFAEFSAQSSRTLATEAQGQVHRLFRQRVAEQQTLLQPVESLLRRAPVSCVAATPLRAALERMRAEQVGTIAVVDADAHPIGIFTLTDLMERVVLPGLPLETAVGEVMTPRPGAVAADATAQEALAVMATHGFHQLVITRDGRLCGVLSERDLFSLQRVSMQHVLATIRGARDVTALWCTTGDIATLADNLLAQGAAAEPLTRTIAALNDALAVRLIDLLAPAHALEGLRWCWLSLGSEGRREQTIASDQDNALIFSAPAGEHEEARRRLLGFARAVNEALAGLGVPLCPGEIMAGNPANCLSVEEWRGRFAAWLREPQPAALLAANIYFDFRPLAGELTLADNLRRWLTELAPQSPIFLRLLTANALEAEPPLGRVRSFVTGDGEHRGLLDLKAAGTRLFVDAARALALAFGIAETGTAPRLRLAGRRLGLEEREVAALVEAFQFLQLLRLRAQRDQLATEGGAAAEGNRVDPYALNELDQRMLKESLRQARTLQRLLEQTLAR
ncbi:MAG: CBS domain-containing protein [Proteobacteria bacterium]|nr:CBS domain-containing protein [Pseudomonadota bacterium]